LAQAVARAGLDLAELAAAISAPGETERLDSIISANQAAQREGGHYGVPLMVFEGEPFFGQDRFDQLVWRMGQRGLAKR
jgi:2-hydroxychromene-2-carboxylate isomerase